MDAMHVVYCVIYPVRKICHFSDEFGSKMRSVWQSALENSRQPWQGSSHAAKASQHDSTVAVCAIWASEHVSRLSGIRTKPPLIDSERLIAELEANCVIGIH